MMKSPVTSDKALVVQQKLANGHELLPFPRVVDQLLSAIKEPDATPDDIAKIIESDAGLATRLLRMANSPIYGFSNVIQSISHATVILGLSRLRTLALTFAGTTLFSGKDAAGAQREVLWSHSLGCATAARQIARTVKAPNPDEAFLAGIFHDVGKLFFLDAVPDDYLEIVSSKWGDELVQYEQELFGMTHQEVGVKLINSWQLPEQIMVAVGYHHQPTSSIAHTQLTSIVYVANKLAHEAGIGSTAKPEIDLLPNATEFLGMDESDLAFAREESLETFEETRQACSG